MSNFWGDSIFDPTGTQYTKQFPLLSCYIPNIATVSVWRVSKNQGPQSKPQAVGLIKQGRNQPFYGPPEFFESATSTGY